MGGVWGWLASGGLQPILAALATGIGGGGIVVKLWEHRRLKRAQTDNVALALVKELGNRVEKLEAQLQAEQTACAAALKVERHARANLTMCVEMLLLGYKLPELEREANLRRVHERLGRIDDVPAELPHAA